MGDVTATGDGGESTRGGVPVVGEGTFKGDGLPDWDCCSASARVVSSNVKAASTSATSLGGVGAFSLGPNHDVLFSSLATARSICAWTAPPGCRLTALRFIGGAGGLLLQDLGGGVIGCVACGLPMFLREFARPNPGGPERLEPLYTGMLCIRLMSNPRAGDVC